jgi:hypothetical protein
LCQSIFGDMGTREICAIRSAATRGTCPLRHVSRPSMAHSVADVLSAHDLRGQVPHIPASSGGFKHWGFRSTRIHKIERGYGGYTPRDLTRHDCRDAGGRAMQEQLPRTSRMSPHGRVHGASLGVHPPCRRGSVSTNLTSCPKNPCAFAILGLSLDHIRYQRSYKASEAKSANRERSPRCSVICAECSHCLKRSTANVNPEVVSVR